MKERTGKGVWLNRRKKDIIFAFILILPAAYILGKVFIYPIYQTAIWSLYHYNLMESSNVFFVGLENYKEIVESNEFWIALKRTWFFAMTSVSLELILGFFSALFLHQMFKGRTIFRLMIILPWSVLTIANGLLWNWIYQPGYGALTIILRSIGILGPTDNPVWLANSDNIIYFAIIADVWKMTPFVTLILLAGLQSIPTSLYEASMLDGAGFWKKIKHVTIPLLLPAILGAAVLRTVGAFKVYDILTVFTGDPTTSVSYLTFNYGFRYFHLGTASAMAWITTAFILILVVLYIRLLKKSGDHY